MEVGIVFAREHGMEADFASFVDRRKEVNMVKRTKGFGWSASGVSTALWRGVPITEVLRDWGLFGIPAGERWSVRSSPWCAVSNYLQVLELRRG